MPTKSLLNSIYTPHSSIGTYTIPQRHFQTYPSTVATLLQSTHIRAKMFFASPTSNISPALVSVAMTRSDSRDSQTSLSSFSSQTTQIMFNSIPSTYRSNSSCQTSSTRLRRDSLSAGWIPSPYRSCMQHSSSSQGSDYSSVSSYISDDDLLALDDIALPIERISNPTSAPRQESRREMTTEEHIAMLREVQEREQAQMQQQRRQQQQRVVRFASEQRKPRRPSGGALKRSNTTRRSWRQKSKTFWLMSVLLRLIWIWY